MRGVLIVVFVLCILDCALSGDVMAQSNPCTSWVGNGCDIGFAVIACPGTFNCQTEGPFLLVCLAMNTACAVFEPCPTCPSGSSPISLASGNTWIEEVDARIPGLSGGLTLVRRWNSVWPSTETAFQVGFFGPNWRSNFEERIFVGSDNYIKYARGDGSFWSFGVNGAGWGVAAPANVAARLTQNSTNWTITFPNGEKRLFDFNSGSLTQIIDRNGNTTQLSYDSLNRLVTVTDPASRHLTFTYASSSSYLITGVSSDVGLSLTYSYDTQGRLIQVTKPDLSTLNFSYNSQSLITAVTDSNGKVLESHTYDSGGRGLTGARAGGVEALTLTYPNPQ